MTAERLKCAAFMAVCYCLILPVATLVWPLFMALDALDRAREAGKVFWTGFRSDWSSNARTWKRLFTTHPDNWFEP